MQPDRPRHAPEHVDLCLSALASEGLGDKLSLGGALGLLCYLDYRSTHDVDAWWQPETTPAERSRVVATIRGVRFDRGEPRAAGGRDAPGADRPAPPPRPDRRPGERAIAERARRWYETELLDALVD